MVSLDLVDDSTKMQILSTWKNMSELDKSHFINQVALAMSIWGSDEQGKLLVVDVLKLLSQEGCGTLADFGLYIDSLFSYNLPPDTKDMVQRAAVVVEGYRIKNSLPSVPHKDIGI
ncbi:hypothetical protein HY990_03155 [Candidatus Micrarchaeota archaeon]|nr:hypothetical protein [Candidatus Micrarchaeota archaeon]